MKNFKILFAITATFYCAFVYSLENISNGKRVLIVVSSYGKSGGIERPGFELDELSQAYYMFKDNDFSIDIASPKGGAVEADEYNNTKAYNKRFLNDIEAQDFIKNTKTTASLINEEFEVIFIVGGKGAMFDLPNDPSLQDLILKHYNQNKIISSVCHGSASLVNIKLDETSYLVNDKVITGFCNEEEKKFGKKWINEFPFLLETKLIERGANYKRGKSMLPFVVKDGFIVTGQNPYSTTLVVEQILHLLNQDPKPRILYDDERSMQLVKRVHEGEYSWAKSELSKNNKNYDLSLIAVYGYYDLLFATDNVDLINDALSVLDLVCPYYFNENLQLERAKGMLKVNRTKESIAILNELIEKNLLKEEATQVLLSIK